MSVIQNQLLCALLVHNSSLPAINLLKWQISCMLLQDHYLFPHTKPVFDHPRRYPLSWRALCVRSLYHQPLHTLKEKKLIQ